MSPTKWLKQNYVSGCDENELIKKGSKKLNLPHNRLCARLSDLKRGTWWKKNGFSSLPEKPATPKGSIFLTDKDLASRHDAYYKIRVAAQKLGKGQYIEDADFRDHAVQMSTGEYRRPADNAEFDKYKGKAGSKTYWGHPDSIKAKKVEGVLK